MGMCRLTKGLVKVLSVKLLSVLILVPPLMERKPIFVKYFPDMDLVLVRVYA